MLSKYAGSTVAVGWAEESRGVISSSVCWTVVNVNFFLAMKST
jgi:hypothetical protein